MSEITPVPPVARRLFGTKRPSRGCLIKCGLGLLVMAYLVFRLYAMIEAEMWQSHTRWVLGRALNGYVDDHHGRLPPTFGALKPKYLEDDNLFLWGYRDGTKRRWFEWLYFPKEKLDGLPSGTILLAAPLTASHLFKAKTRLTWGPSGWRSIPEVEFQRLIREQTTSAAK